MRKIRAVNTILWPVESSRESRVASTVKYKKSLMQRGNWHDLYF